MKKNAKLLCILIVSILAIAMMFTGCGTNAYEGNAAPQGKGESNYDIVVTDDRLIVYDVNMTITVDNITATIKQVREKLRESDGWETTVNQNSDGYASIKMRVPTKNLGAFLDMLESTGMVENCNIFSEDITEKYTATAQQKEVMVKYRDMLEEQLAATDNFSEKQEIMKQLSEVAAKIDGLDDEMSSYKKKADYSTVTLYIYGASTYEEPSPWDKIGDVFFSSTSSLGRVIGIIFQIIAALLPYAAFAAFVFGMVMLTAFIVCKIRKKPFTWISDHKERKRLTELKKQKIREKRKQEIQALEASKNNE